MPEIANYCQMIGEIRTYAYMPLRRFAPAVVSVNRIPMRHSPFHATVRQYIEANLPRNPSHASTGLRMGAPGLLPVPELLLFRTPY